MIVGVYAAQSEKATTHDVLDADKTSLYRSTVAKLELQGRGQAGHPVRCESVLQVHVEPKSQ